MKRLTAVAAILVTVLVIVGGYASAQEEVQVATEPDPALAQADSELAGAARDGKNLTSEQRLLVGQKRIGRMRNVLAQTSGLLVKVRESDDDIRRVNCINVKVATMRGFVKVSEQSYTNLRVAAGKADETSELHHFGIISIAGEKVRDLGEEAQTCVGDVQVFADETVVDRQVDPDLADVNPIEPDDDEFDDAYAIDPLPELTPFQ